MSTFTVLLNRSGRCELCSSALDLDGVPILLDLTSVAVEGGGDRVTAERAWCGVCGTPAEIDEYLLAELLADRDVEHAAALDAEVWLSSTACPWPLAWALVRAARGEATERDCDEAAAELATAMGALGE